MKSPHILCLPVLLAAAVTSMAQPASGPQPVSGMSYTKYKNKLYIYGGWDGIRLGVNTELFVLDLSKSWTSESPSWYRLPAGPAMTDSTSAMSPDGQTLILIPSKEGETFRFSVSSHSWVRSSAIFRNTTMGASPVLLEPNGKVLVVGGRSATFNKPFDDQYDLYSFNNDKLETARLPEFLEGKKVRFAPNSKGYRSVWSRYLKKALLYGGEYDKVLSDYLISDTVSMYDPVTAQWSEMKTLDFTINSVSDHCMATTEDGKKLIVYGGYVLMNGTQVDNYSLRMLDLVTRKWETLGLLEPGRSRAACAVAGDHFLVWGGQTTGPTGQVIDVGKPTTPVHILKISTGQWVQRYEPSPEYINPELYPPAGSDQESEGRSLKIGAIVGGVVGAMAVVIIVGFVVRRRLRHRTRSSGSDHGEVESEVTEDEARGERSYYLQATKKATYPLPPSHDVSRSSTPHYPAWGTSYTHFTADETRHSQAPAAIVPEDSVNADVLVPQSKRSKKKGRVRFHLRSDSPPRSPSALPPPDKDDDGYVPPPPSAQQQQRGPQLHESGLDRVASWTQGTPGPQWKPKGAVALARSLKK